MKLIVLAVLGWTAVTAFAGFGDVLGSFPTPAGGTNGLAWDGTRLWSVYSPGGMFSGHYFFEINASTGSVVSSFYLEHVVTYENALGLAARPPDTLYATIRMNTRLVCLTTTGSILWTFQSAIIYYGRGLSWDGAYFWCTDGLSNRTVIQFQNRTENEIISSFTLPMAANEMEYWGGDLLVTAAGTLYKMTTTGSVLASHAVPASGGCTCGGGYIWVGGSYIYRIDPGQTRVEPAALGKIKALYR